MGLGDILYGHKRSLGDMLTPEQVALLRALQALSSARAPYAPVDRSLMQAPAPLPPVATIGVRA